MLLRDNDQKVHNCIYLSSAGTAGCDHLPKSGMLVFALEWRERDTHTLLTGMSSRKHVRFS